MSIFGTVLSVAGTALGFLGSKKESEAQKDVAKQNLAAAKKEGEYQRWKSTVEQGRLSDVKNAIVARQTVMFAKAGVQLDSGTVESVMRDTLLQYQKDMDILKMQGQFNVERAEMGIQVADEQVTAARTAGYLSMGRTLLQGASSIYDAWSK